MRESAGEYIPEGGENTVLDGFRVHGRIEGTPVSFVRRYYGNTCFCWVYVYSGDGWHPLGDPWPVQTPPREEIVAAAPELFARAS